MATTKSTAAKKPVATKSAAEPAARKSATAKVIAKKVTVETAPPKTAAVKKPATTVSKAVVPAAVKKPAAPTPEQRYRMVQDAAYFIAERHGFASNSMDCWIAAEAEIEALLSGKGKK